MGLLPFGLCIATQLLAALGFLVLTVGGVRPSLAGLEAYWLAVAAVELGCCLLALAAGRPLRSGPQVPLPVRLLGCPVTLFALLAGIRMLRLPFIEAAGLGAATGLAAELALLALWPRLPRLRALDARLRWCVTPTEAPAADASRRGRWLALLLCLAGAVLLGVLFAPRGINWAIGGLDGAWSRIVPWAAAQGLVFGRDLVFTYGPLGGLFASVASAGDFTAALVYGGVRALLFGTGLWLLAGQQWRWSLLAIWLVLPLIAPQHYNSGYVHAFALLVFLVGREPGALRLAWTIAACALLAVFALGKLSHAPAAVVAVAALDLDRWLGRRAWPLFVPLFLAALLLAQLAAGQPLSGLLDLLAAFRLLGSGYAQAMQQPVASGEALLLLPCLVAIVALSALAATRQALATPDRARRTLLLPLATLPIAFFIWKAGMVRGHLNDVCTGLALLALFTAMGPIADAWPRRRWALPAGLGIAALSLALQFSFYDASPALAARHAAGAPAQMASLLSGQAWRDLEASAAALEAGQREAEDWPPLEGSVDVLGNHQLPALAWHLDYRPRPVMQSYVAYNPALAQLNLEHLRSAAAPQHLFDDWRALDGHLPTLEDGPARLEVLARYRLVGTAGSYLQFVRRAEPRSLTLRPLATLTLPFNQAVALPDPGGVLFARIELQRTLAGRLAELLWRAPHVELALEIAAPRLRRYLLVPGMAAAGFLLQPLVGDPNAARLFYASDGTDPALLPARIRSLTLELPKPVRWFYEPTAELTLWQVELGPETP